MRPPERARDRALRVALWAVFWTLAVLWAALLWHPWIDWFGRVQPR